MGDDRVFGVKVPELGPGLHDMVRASDAEQLRGTRDGLREEVKRLVAETKLAQQERDKWQTKAGENRADVLRLREALEGIETIAGRHDEWEILRIARKTLEEASR